MKLNDYLLQMETARDELANAVSMAREARKTGFPGEAPETGLLAQTLMDGKADHVIAQLNTTIDLIEKVVNRKKATHG